MTRKIGEVYKDGAGEFRWRIRAANGEIIASSGESFDSYRNATDALQRVIDLEASGATVSEEGDTE